MKALEQKAIAVEGNEPSVYVKNEDDTYGGAHQYLIKKSKGFIDGARRFETTKPDELYRVNEYIIDPTSNVKNIYEAYHVKFLQKNGDGTFIPGILSEDLVMMLIDRHQKLNNAFPSSENEKAIEHLTAALECWNDRVRERMARNVMGDLVK